MSFSFFQFNFLPSGWHCSATCLLKSCSISGICISPAFRHHVHFTPPFCQVISRTPTHWKRWVKTSSASVAAVCRVKRIHAALPVLLTSSCRYRQQPAGGVTLEQERQYLQYCTATCIFTNDDIVVRLICVSGRYDTDSFRPRWCLHICRESKLHT